MWSEGETPAGAASNLDVREFDPGSNLAPAVLPTPLAVAPPFGEPTPLANNDRMHAASMSHNS